MSISPTVRTFALSFLTTATIIAVCVISNLLGSAGARFVNSIMFIDLTGTAIASLCFGPVHGALVGLISNYLGEFYVGPSLGLDYRTYFLFAPVHMAAALVWGLVPRMMKGRLGTDYFCDDDKLYPAGKLFLSIVATAVASSMAAAGMISYIYRNYDDAVGCPSIARLAGSVHPASVHVCDLVRIIFNEPNYNFGYQPLKIFTVAGLLGIPDHIVCFSIAILLVAFVAEGRRYRMSGIFGTTIITNRRSVATIVYLALVLFFVWRIEYAFEINREIPDANNNGPFADLAFGAIYITALFGMVVCGFFRLTIHITDYRAQIFRKVNPALKDAVEDALKFASILAIVAHLVLGSLCKAHQCQDALSRFLDDKLTGAVGIVFLISFSRYAALMLARVLQFLRKELPEHPVHFDSDAA